MTPRLRAARNRPYPFTPEGRRALQPMHGESDDLRSRSAMLRLLKAIVCSLKRK